VFRFVNLNKCCKAYYAIAYKFFIFLMQFPQVGGSDSQQYAVAVRLSPNPSLPTDTLVHQHSARTCGRRAHQVFPSDLELVKWNEIFFFKVDSLVLDNFACFHLFFLMVTLCCRLLSFMLAFTNYLEFSSPEFLINIWLCLHKLVFRY
jgi:hypothetical protein